MRRLEGLIPPGFGEYIFGQTGKANRVFDTHDEVFVLCEVSSAKLISEIYLFEVCTYVGSAGSDYATAHEVLYEMTEATLHEMFHQHFIYNNGQRSSKISE